MDSQAMQIEHKQYVLNTNGLYSKHTNPFMMYWYVLDGIGTNWFGLNRVLVCIVQHISVLVSIVLVLDVQYERISESTVCIWIEYSMYSSSNPTIVVLNTNQRTLNTNRIHTNTS